MAGFKKGWSGSNFHTGYQANEGQSLAAGSKRGDRTINADSGAEGRRVTANYTKNTSKSGSSKKS